MNQRFIVFENSTKGQENERFNVTSSLEYSTTNFTNKLNKKVSSIQFKSDVFLVIMKKNKKNCDYSFSRHAHCQLHSQAIHQSESCTSNRNRSSNPQPAANNNEASTKTACGCSLIFLIKFNSWASKKEEKKACLYFVSCVCLVSRKVFE